ncbi:hypothetical protein HanXRQr2_Chr10g0441101 [Helianthus annuus]|uniref:Uncharacterized protein n=1 Tax=Helianthus annuus TaxID=4232 RepID=A0A9K3HX24_HELAN|nr:hypothetical protein HanXRQr2_Chr10g0441101 [Helianthus annuus]KAJ0521826.1 hypothetical protein HanIR_Chr10g0475481 [Helianthus annuus]
MLIIKVVNHFPPCKLVIINYLNFINLPPSHPSLDPNRTPISCTKSAPTKPHQFTIQTP